MDKVVNLDRRTKDLKFEKNPFLANTVAEVDIGYKTTTFGKGSSSIGDLESGELLGEAAFKQVKVVDKSQFLMMYLAGQNIFWDLSQRAQKTIRFILNEVQHRAIGKDEIYLSWELGEKFFKSKEIKMGRSTYFKGITELTEKKIIAESIRTNIWFINPLLIFNGNRATFVQQIIAKDPNLVDEAQAITAKRINDAMGELDDKTIKKIGDEMKIKVGK